MFPLKTTGAGQIIALKRRDRRDPPSGLGLQMRMNEVDKIYEDLMSLMKEAPAALLLDSADSPT